MTISVSEFHTKTDRYAYAHEQLVAALAHAGWGNARTAMDNDVTATKAYTDAFNVADLIKGPASAKKAMTVQSGATYPAVMVPSAAFADFISGLNKNLGTGGVNGFCEANGAQVISSFRDLYDAVTGLGALKNKWVQPPVTNLATGTITGATAVTFGASSAVNIDASAPPAYGAQQCEAVVTTEIASDDASGPVVVTATMKKYDGTTETKTFNLAHELAVAQTVDIATADDRYIDCTALAVSNGDSGAFTVRTKAPRTSGV